MDLEDQEPAPGNDFDSNRCQKMAQGLQSKVWDIKNALIVVSFLFSFPLINYCYSIIRALLG